MTANRQLIIEPLHNEHDRLSFRCGVASLDVYLQRQAKQAVKRRISRTFIARWLDDKSTVVGYYSLSTLSVELEQLPESLARKLPKHPIPCALMGRLAVSKETQGTGIGHLLLADAVKRTLDVSKQIAIYAMVVDAIDDKAIGFYQQYGFIIMSSCKKRLFLPLKNVTSSNSPE